MNKKCSRKGCINTDLVNRQGMHICKFHLVLYHAIHHSKRKYKYFPSYEELENLIKDNPNCPHCKTKMIMLSKKTTKNKMTLQHNRDGTIQLLCHSCNSKHRNCEDDEFYEIPLDSKKCTMCKKILKRTSFYKMGSGYPYGRCKDCYCKVIRERRKTVLYRSRL